MVRIVLRQVAETPALDGRPLCQRPRQLEGLEQAVNGLVCFQAGSKALQLQDCLLALPIICPIAEQHLPTDLCFHGGKLKPDSCRVEVLSMTCFFLLWGSHFRQCELDGLGRALKPFLDIPNV